MDLYQFLKQAAAQKLEEYEKVLEAEVQKELEPLQRELHKLEQMYEAKKTARLKESDAKAEFEIAARSKFKVTEEIRKQMRTAFSSEFEAYFNDLQNHTRYLEKAVSELPKTEGVVLAGKSYGLLQTILHGTKVVLKQDEALTEQAGFVFESSTLLVDARVSILENEMFETKSGDIYQILNGS